MSGSLGARGAVATGGRSRPPLLVLRSQEFTRRGDHLAPHDFEIALDERASCPRVTATSELLGKLVHVYIARASERDLHLVVPQVPEEDREARAADRPRMLGNSFQILRPQAVLLGGACRNRDPRAS